MVVRAALAFDAPARPVNSLSFSYFFILPSSLAFAKMLFLVFANILYVLFRPAPVLASVHPDLIRRTNLSSSHPIVQRDPMNPDFSGRFLRRISSDQLYTSLF